MNGTEQAYSSIAAIGVVLLTLRAALPALGLRPDKLFGLPSVQFESPGGDFKSGLMSFRAIASFLAAFGIAGFCMIRYEDAGIAVSATVAIIAGTAVASAAAALFREQSRRSGPPEFRTSKAIGQRGIIYMAIPPGGTGKITVTINDRLTVLDALAHDKSGMNAGESVEVLEVVSQNVLLVRRV